MRSSWNGIQPTWVPWHPTLQHFRDAINRAYFWADVKNSLIVVGAVVALDPPPQVSMLRKRCA